MGITKRSFTIWGVIIVVCIISFFVRGLAQSIDFTGGRNFVVQFEQSGRTLKQFVNCSSKVR